MEQEIEDPFQISIDRIMEYIGQYSHQMPERDYIETILFYHEMEPSAATERISREYEIPYEIVYRLLP